MNRWLLEYVAVGRIECLSVSENRGLDLGRWWMTGDGGRVHLEMPILCNNKYSY
jgi:hypothetical protein